MINYSHFIDVMVSMGICQFITVIVPYQITSPGQQNIGLKNRPFCTGIRFVQQWAQLLLHVILGFRSSITAHVTREAVLLKQMSCESLDVKSNSNAESILLRKQFS